MEEALSAPRRHPRADSVGAGTLSYQDALPIALVRPTRLIGPPILYPFLSGPRMRDCWQLYTAGCGGCTIDIELKQRKSPVNTAGGLDGKGPS